VPLSPSNIIWY